MPDGQRSSGRIASCFLLLLVAYSQVIFPLADGVSIPALLVLNILFSLIFFVSDTTQSGLLCVSGYFLSLLKNSHLTPHFHLLPYHLFLGVSKYKLWVSGCLEIKTTLFPPRLFPLPCCIQLLIEITQKTNKKKGIGNPNADIKM